MWVDAYCSYPFDRVRVTADGYVAMCCFMRPNPITSKEEAYLGNVLEQPFDEIWFGTVAEDVRRSVREGYIHPKCGTPGCPFYRATPPYPRKRVGYSEYPNFLEIDLPNTHCNVGGLRPHPVKSPACIMCERAAPWFEPEQNRLDEVIARIKHILPSIQHIHIQGIAEPFYQTRENGYLLFEMLDALDFDQHANEITISVTTNGTLLKESVRKEYLARVPHSITIFSIDASTAETYKKIRILDCFEKVLENLYAFSRERNRTRQFLKVHDNINTLNVGEITGMVHIAHQANVDSLEFNPTDGFNFEILVTSENCGVFRKAQEDAVEEARRLNVPISFLRPLDLGITDNLVQLTL